jgi:hypothetical protein
MTPKWSAYTEIGAPEEKTMTKGGGDDFFIEDHPTAPRKLRRYKCAVVGDV